ncbi:DUF6492 family protein [Bradyrhizobium sp.]|uniref:DUF6492 family protein n=1 Tax=Bradyrhizobium sp. TaxID=376 RepID=UPI003D139B7E
MRVRSCNIRSRAVQQRRMCLTWLPHRKLTNFEMLRWRWAYSAPILLFLNTKKQGPPETDDSVMIPNAVRDPDEMNPVALLTPTYGRDLELCTLLCESVDRHVSSFSKHYLLVPDSDLPLFSRFESERRTVLPASQFLPGWLRPLPSIFQRKRRQYWWSLRAKPASGWHVQQILKIAAAIALPHRRYCILDSDVVFFRDFDLSRFEYPNSIPLLSMPGMVTPDQVNHSRWVDTSHQLLGLPRPSLPASDFIGHIIFWDQETTRAMAAKIAAIAKRDWIEALCRTREFSEYMLYGYFVQSDAQFARRHSPGSRTGCVSYWDSPKLGKTELNRLLGGADQDDVAFSAASFSGTPVQIIRSAIEETRALLAPRAAAKQPAGLEALC